MARSPREASSPQESSSPSSPPPFAQPTSGRMERLSPAPPISICETPRFDNREPIWVYLYVIPPVPSRCALEKFGNQNHWCLSWDTDPRRFRERSEHHLHNADDIQFDPKTPCGGLEVFVEKKSSMRVVCPITQMSAQQLAMLERIAEGTPAQGWDSPCKQWCLTVLKQACEKGLVTQQEITFAVYKASSPP